MSFKMAKVGELKEGSYAIINDEPSQIVQIQKSKPGKHGSAKFRCTAISLFDGRKQSFVSSTDASIMIPIVDKRNGQIVSVSPASVQLMDLETYETFDLEIPEELKADLAEGATILYWEILGQHVMKQIK